VVDIEDQGKVERVGAGGEGFLQNAVTPDVFEANAARRVFVEVVRRDRSGAQGADARNQDVPVSGVRPGGTPVFEPGQQGVAGELAEALPVTGDGDAPTGQVDIVQGEFAGLGGIVVDGLLPAAFELADATPDQCTSLDHDHGSVLMLRLRRALAASRGISASLADLGRSTAVATFDGEDQSVAAAPTQRADDCPVGDRPGGIDTAVFRHPTRPVIAGGHPRSVHAVACLLESAPVSLNAAMEKACWAE
jgi:hypothetical protein